MFFFFSFLMNSLSPSCNALITFIVPPTPPGSVPTFPTHQLCVQAGVLPGLNFHGSYTCCHRCYEFIHAAVLLCPKPTVSLQSSIASGSCPLSTHSSSTIPEPWEQSQQLLSRDNHHLLALFPTFGNSLDPSLLPTRDPQAIPHSNETQVGYPHSLSQHLLVVLPQSPIATGQVPPPPPSPLQGLDSSQPPHKGLVSYYMWLGNLHSGLREVLTAD